MSETMVMGPTPPGTGVMYEQRGATSSKHTSPVSFQPLGLSALGRRVVPTSITTAPSFTISAVTKLGQPIAAIMMSAVRHISLMLGVPLWHIVTVALPGLLFCIISDATGLPTMLLRPSTTQCLPLVSML